MSDRDNPIWYGPGDYGCDPDCHCGSADEHDRRCLALPAVDDDTSPQGAE